jgi:hypothetical protein
MRYLQAAYRLLRSAARRLAQFADNGKRFAAKIGFDRNM